MEIDTGHVADRIRSDHAGLLEKIETHADAVAADWADETVADPEAITTPLRRRLADAGLLASLPEILETAASAADLDLPAEPVPAPPYVVVTSHGPVLRATVDTGRLVVRVAVFDLRRPSTGAPPQYGRSQKGAPLTVEWVPSQHH
ncbi:MAG: hypothetical protein ABEJ35_00785 [Halobacteriaceae archaeon]